MRFQKTQVINNFDILSSQVCHFYLDNIIGIVDRAYDVKIPKYLRSKIINGYRNNFRTGKYGRLPFNSKEICISFFDAFEDACKHEERLIKASKILRGFYEIILTADENIQTAFLGTPHLEYYPKAIKFIISLKHRFFDKEAVKLINAFQASTQKKLYDLYMNQREASRGAVSN